MTTLVKIAIAFVISLFLSSCGLDSILKNMGPGIKGNSVIVEQDRKVTEDFTTISASEGIQVYVTQADEYRISITADENIIDLIGTDIENGKLKIQALKNIGHSTKKVMVSLPNLKALHSSSGAHISTENTIKSNHLTLEASSGSMLGIELIGNQLEVNTSSGANLWLSGKVNNTLIEASSGSKIEAKELSTVLCNAQASSGSSVTIAVTESLQANANSGGYIAYTGDPEVQKNESVSGSIRAY